MGSPALGIQQILDAPVMEKVRTAADVVLCEDGRLVVAHEIEAYRALLRFRV